MMIASVFVLLVMVVLLCSSMWIGFALLGTGLLSLEWFRDVPIQRILAQDVWSRLNADELVTHIDLAGVIGLAARLQNDAAGVEGALQVRLDALHVGGVHG